MDDFDTPLMSTGQLLSEVTWREPQHTAGEARLGTAKKNIPATQAAVVAAVTRPLRLPCRKDTGPACGLPQRLAEPRDEAGEGSRARVEQQRAEDQVPRAEDQVPRGVGGPPDRQG